MLPFLFDDVPLAYLVSSIFSILLIGILGTDVIDRGRNIVSCSRDGTARLWDCGEGKCLEIIFKGDGAPINGCSVGVSDNSVNLGIPDKPAGI